MTATKPSRASHLPSIVAHGLTKRYGRGRLVAVADVSFQVVAGCITGLLGPSGSGKTTVMRMLVGQTEPTAGYSRVLGMPYQQLENPDRQVGVLPESVHYRGGTGHELLTIWAMLMRLPKHRVDEMLALVGLAPTAARSPLNDYSQAMRQRLGIARALLADPQVLILDEPANGLDVDGIRWMRDLLRDFADRGGAVLLTSRLPQDVGLIADRVILIEDGRIPSKPCTDGRSDVDQASSADRPPRPRSSSQTS